MPNDGEIALFDGIYYLYGTSYDCDYEWGNKSAPFCDISGNHQRAQSFVATRSGTLNKVCFTSSKSGYPNAGLIIEIYLADKNYQPTGKTLSSSLVPTDSIGWAPKYVTVYPDISVDANSRYAIVVKSTSSTGCYQVNT